MGQPRSSFMRGPQRRRGLLIAAGAIVLAPAWSLAAGLRLVGSGKVATERRELTGFRALHVKADFKVIVQPGSREGLELRGDDNLLPAVETRIVEAAGSPRTLELRWREGVSVSARQPVTLIVEVVELKAIAVSGSGKVEGASLGGSSLALAVAGSGEIELKGLKQGEVSATIAGSGDIELEGRATQFSAGIAGSGELNAGQLEAETVAVKVSGSGNASVHASRSLAVSIAGSGNVAYRGAAEPQVSIAGSGRVRRL